MLFSILLLAPLMVIGALGVYYVWTPRLTAYHVAIEQRLGAPVLSRVFLGLWGLNSAGFLALFSYSLSCDIGRALTTPIFLVGAVIHTGMVPLVAVLENGAYIGLVTLKRIAGASTLSLTCVLWGGLSSHEPGDVAFQVAALAETLVLLCVTAGAWWLGRRSGARTPWIALAIMTALATIGLVGVL